MEEALIQNVVIYILVTLMNISCFGLFAHEAYSDYRESVDRHYKEHIQAYCREKCFNLFLYVALSPVWPITLGIFIYKFLTKVRSMVREVINWE